MKVLGLVFALIFLSHGTVAAAPQVRQPRHAIEPQEQPLCAGCPTASEVKKFNEFQQKMGLPPIAPQVAPTPTPTPMPAAVSPASVAPPPVTVAPAEPSPAAPPGVPPTPPSTQNTITTTAPVSSETTISVGTLAGQVLTWAVTAFGSLVATIFAAWGIRLFKLAGVQITDAARDRLQQIILNGLNNAAQNVTHDIAGKGQVDVKDAVVQQAIAYAQSHGADAIKQLGLDPNSGAAIEAIKARIATAVADPSVPTPPILNGSNPIPAKAA